MKRISTTMAVLALTTAAALACGGSPTCTVADPTGTPLNIRVAPNQTIIGNASNGTVLDFIDHIEHEGKTWARVAAFDPATEELNMGGGFLFGAYLDCDGEVTDASNDDLVLCKVADPTGTPLNVRDTPNGMLLGSVRNDQMVRVYGHQIQNGKVWALAYRDVRDNAVGFVFDAYLKCEEDGH
ncbi:MAG: hypothetical protein AAGH82_10395 [Pseudomonadota bacterium]